MDELYGTFATMPSTYRNVTCPFCALLCDDLLVSRSDEALQVLENGCKKAIAGFERAVEASSPLSDGQPISLQKAITRAAEMLRQAKSPLYAGLGTEVEGMRAVMAIADRTGGIVDHMNGNAMMRNLRAFQYRGWMTTTMAEVKNRADLLIFVGTDARDYPRFFERIVWSKWAMFNPPPQGREIVFLGCGLDLPGGRSPKQVKASYLSCDIKDLGNVIAALRALLNGYPLQAKSVAGITIAELKALGERMRVARYGVMIWEPAKLDFPHADLTIQMVCELVKDLNRTLRFTGFPLGGNEGGQSIQSVCAWQSGYPLRVSFARGHPEYDPDRYATERLLANREVDVLIWISSITAGRTPPVTAIPTLVLSEPGMKFAQEPSVYIPVGTPGLDHRGRMIRCDNVVSLPLQRVRGLHYPSVATVLESIQQAL
jgi:formylmethanofuran dehydrogenase subunit B